MQISYCEKYSTWKLIGTALYNESMDIYRKLSELENEMKKTTQSEIDTMQELDD